MFFAGVVTTVLSILVWRAGNKFQDAVRADANARIAEAGNSAELAKERATNAEARAGEANKEAGRANERAGELELRAQELAGQNLALRSGVANLETEAANARAAQQNIQTELAKQQERAANAERALLELQERIRPRTLPAVFMDVLKEKPQGGIVTVLYRQDVHDAFDLANSILLALERARWHLGGIRQLRQEEAAIVLSDLPPVMIRIGDVGGILMAVRWDGRNRGPVPGEGSAVLTLREAFKEAGFEVKQIPPAAAAALIPADRRDVPKIFIIIGPKPSQLVP